MIENDNMSSRQFEIGRALERARERRGLSLGEAEQATKIRARYLEELEQGNFEVLPPVYAQGSLRTYASYLGLDAGVLVTQLRRGQGLQSGDPSPASGGDAPEEEDSSAPDSAAAGADVDGAVTDEEDGGREDEAETGVRGWLPGGDELRSYLGMVALVVVVLPAAVLALTLADRDLTPTPVRAPVADDRANGEPRGAGDRAEGERVRLADESRREGDRANTKDEGDARSLGQGDRRGAQGLDDEKAESATGDGPPAPASPAAAVGAAPPSAATVPPASAPVASTAPATASPATASPATASPATASPATVPPASSTSGGVPDSTASPAASPTAPPTGPGAVDVGVDPSTNGTGVLGADSAPAPVIPDVGEEIYPSSSR